MKIVRCIILLFILYSCDPEENRMIIYNNSNDDVYVEIINKDDKELIRYYPLKKIEPYSNQRITKLFSWESYFDDIKPDSLLTIIVYKNKYIKTEKSENVNETDSLLMYGDYEFKSYSYNDLIKMDWVIKYPSDGFSKGEPLK